jgi:hypothetical protein
MAGRLTRAEPSAHSGHARPTPYLQELLFCHARLSEKESGFGERVRIEMLDAVGRSIFGAIDQMYVHYQGTRAAQRQAG